MLLKIFLTSFFGQRGFTRIFKTLRRNEFADLPRFPNAKPPRKPIGEHLKKNWPFLRVRRGLLGCEYRCESRYTQRPAYRLIRRYSRGPHWRRFSPQTAASSLPGSGDRLKMRADAIRKRSLWKRDSCAVWEIRTQNDETTETLIPAVLVFGGAGIEASVVAGNPVYHEVTVVHDEPSSAGTLNQTIGTFKKRIRPNVVTDPCLS